MFHLFLVRFKYNCFYQNSWHRTTYTKPVKNKIYIPLSTRLRKCIMMALPILPARPPNSKNIYVKYCIISFRGGGGWGGWSRVIYTSSGREWVGYEGHAPKSTPVCVQNYTSQSLKSRHCVRSYFSNVDCEKPNHTRSRLPEACAITLSQSFSVKIYFKISWFPLTFVQNHERKKKWRPREKAFAMFLHRFCLKNLPSIPFLTTKEAGI